MMTMTMMIISISIIDCVRTCFDMTIILLMMNISDDDDNRDDANDLIVAEEYQ